MNKLKLFISVGICGILFTGCGFFGVSEVDCRPQDLKDRLSGYGWTATDKWKEQFAHFWNYRGTEYMSKDMCDNWAIENYKDIVSKEKTLPTNIEEENRLAVKWQICNVMPEWLETKLDEYINQNKNDNKAFIEASKFKESWRPEPNYKGEYDEYRLKVNRLYGANMNIYRLNGRLVYTTKDYSGSYTRNNEMGMPCKFTKIAIKAIESDFIDLGNGKKAKCADLAYGDAYKCQRHFDNVYKNLWEEFLIKKEREEYEQKNKQ